MDTATPATTAAFRGAERRDDPESGQRPQHAARLLELVEAVVADAWESVDRIAVGIGPGGFTGLRIGVATARALAQGRDLPLVGVSSLRALALGAQAPLVLACIDARRGEAFAAAYAGEEQVLAPAALGPDALAAAAGALEGRVLAVGDGALRYRAELEGAGAEVPGEDSPAHRLSALAICTLGADAEPAGRDQLLPDYCREPDATASPRP